MANEKDSAKGSWKLQEIIFVAMLCIVFGVVYLIAVYAAAAMVAAFTPMGIGPMGNEIVFGIWFMVSTLAAYIIQRPGVALVSEVIAALIEVLLGNMYGPMVIVTGLVQGAGAELAFALGRYKSFKTKDMMLAAVFCTIISFVWSFIRSGYGLLSIPVLVMFFVVRLVSSVVFCGFLSKAIGDGLAKTGLLKGYALGRNRA